MKQFLITEGRERNLVAYLEKNNQKDAIEISEEDFRNKLKEKKWLDFQIEKFIDGLKNNPFGDWVQYD